METLELQLEELEEVVQTDYQEIEQEFDRLSHHEAIMQDCVYSLNGLDEGEQNISGTGFNLTPYGIACRS